MFPHRFLYNLRRLQRFIVFVLVSLIVVSILFANWYTAAISLGILSVMLGFALQTPITSEVKLRGPTPPSARFPWTRRSRRLLRAGGPGTGIAERSGCG